ncbi:uncharacterized protein E5676_scaffold108G00430 [Cucumis melo var. makuwa]|uniref:Transposase n=1 Tax=Cucumis melo var. makuwa TaxID=1194695 RepID=A0A5D3C1T0_CUCMM|nr:uncharacterized protein E5676_scaffold108G00430 [Cucumis melo var. makuwa]
MLGGIDKIPCPCKTCRNMNHQTFDVVYEHLVIKGMDPTYRFWYHHGEEVPVKCMFDGQPFCSTSFMSDEKVDEPCVNDDVNEKVVDANTSFDGKMRHPVDSVSWDSIDAKWPDFSNDPRNLRFGLATDGFNPFSNLSSPYSCWPVMLVTYNLPPWLCMSKENIMLTLLIPVSKSNFNLRAVLIWTINDFSACGNLAGCTTKGKTGCPICGEHTHSQWLYHSKKLVYMGHRRFLPPSHPYRRKTSWFDGKVEDRQVPRIANGNAIDTQLKDFQNFFGKVDKKKQKRQKELKEMWKKRSIFFDLPYWKELVLRHNLDVMHVEKNVCESIIGTLLDINGKSKDGYNARKDLQDMNIRHDLHPVERESRVYLPPALHTLSKLEKQLFCKRLYELKVPDGYSSNISNCVSVEETKVMGLKSHDYHVLMQQLLPVVIRGMLPKGPRHSITRICGFFNKICQRVIDRESMLEIEKEVIETLCLFERYFPPSFFDIMTHLVIHLGREVRLCGPVQFRWMYPFERYMKTLKGFVRNQSRPEGCIAERYLAEECILFYKNCVQGSTRLDDKQRRNEEFNNDIILEGRPISTGKEITLSDEVLNLAHQYVLFNTKAVEPYIE